MATSNFKPVFRGQARFFACSRALPAIAMVITSLWTLDAVAVETVLLAAAKPLEQRFAAELAGVGYSTQSATAGTALPGLISVAQSRRIRVVVRVGAQATSAQLWASLLADRTRSVTLTRGANESIGGFALRTAEWVHAWVSSPRAPLRKAPNTPGLIVLPTPVAGTGTPRGGPNSIRPKPSSPGAPATRATGGDVASRIGRSTIGDRATRSVAPPRAATATTPQPLGAAKTRGAAKPSAATATRLATAATPVNDTLGWWSLGAGAGIAGDAGGLGFAGLARLSAVRSVPGWSALALGIAVDLPIRPRRIQGYAGRTDVSEWSATVEARLRIARIPRGALWLSAGLGATRTIAIGRANPGFSGELVDLWSATGRVGAAVGVRVVGPLEVRLQTELTGLTPYPIFVVDGEDVAATRQPAARVLLSLEVQL